MRERIPSWYWAVLSVTVLVVAVLQAAYALGAGGVRIRGQAVDFGREHDKVLFAIDEGRGFVTRGDDDVALVKVRPGVPPFRPLCGRCELDGSLLNLADYMHDGWVYTGAPEIAEIDAVHLETGETLKVDLRRPAPGTTIDPATIPEYAERGLDYAPEKKLDVARLAALYDDGALIDESCMIIQMAGILSLAIVALFGVALLLRPRRK